MQWRRKKGRKEKGRGRRRVGWWRKKGRKNGKSGKENAVNKEKREIRIESYRAGCGECREEHLRGKMYRMWYMTI